MQQTEPVPLVLQLERSLVGLASSSALLHVSRGFDNLEVHFSCGLMLQVRSLLCVASQPLLRAREGSPVRYLVQQDSWMVARRQSAIKLHKAMQFHQQRASASTMPATRDAKWAACFALAGIVSDEQHVAMVHRHLREYVSARRCNALSFTIVIRLPN